MIIIRQQVTIVAATFVFVEVIVNDIAMFSFSHHSAVRNFIIFVNGYAFYILKSNLLQGLTISINKRSMDIGALLDSCSWYDISNFLQTCIKTSLLQTK